MLSTGSAGVAHRELVYSLKREKVYYSFTHFFIRMKKIIFLTVAVLGFVALLPVTVSAAWTAPLLAPPACTAGSPGCDAPVNVSAYSQTKIGQLILSVTSGYSSLLITNKSTGKSTFSLNPYTTDATTKKNFWTINGSSDGSTWLPLVTGREGKVGIGTQINPQEVLDVAGAVKIGTTANANKGTIRWTGTDFEGYMGTKWTSLTAGGGSGAIAVPQSCPSGQYVTGLKSNGSLACAAVYCGEGQVAIQGSNGLYTCGSVTYINALQSTGTDYCYAKSDTTPAWNTVVGGKYLTNLANGNWKQCISVMAALPGTGITHNPTTGATSFYSPAQVPLTDLNSQMLSTSPLKKFLKAAALTMNKTQCRIADRTGDGVVTYDDFVTLDASVGSHSIGKSMFALDCN